MESRTLAGYCRLALNFDLTGLTSTRRSCNLKIVVHSGTNFEYDLCKVEQYAAWTLTRKLKKIVHLGATSLNFYFWSRLVWTSVYQPEQSVHRTVMSPTSWTKVFKLKKKIEFLFDALVLRPRQCLALGG